MISPIAAHILPFHGIAGTEIATLRLAQALRTHGFQSIMFCPGSAVQDMFASEGFRTVLYEQVEPSYRHPKNYWLNSLKLARCFQQERVTLIHCADVLAAEFTSLAALLV